MTAPLGVGLVGASPDSGWARWSLLPAIAATPSLTLAAVATRREATAVAAAERYGAPRWFTDPAAMAASDDVDLVVVSVRAAARGDLLHRLIEQGKPIYCEWPLGIDTGQAESIAVAADATGVRVAIGMQGRWSPGLVHARSLITSGALGDVLSCIALSYLGFAAAPVSPSSEHLLRWVDGGSLLTNYGGALTIYGGHFLDSLNFVLGDLASLSATVAQVVDHIELVDGTTIPSDNPDVISVNGTLTSGAVLHATLTTRSIDGDHTRVEINGTAGALVIETAGMGQIAYPRLRLYRSQHSSEGMVELSFPDDAPRALPEGPARNVARTLAAFADDVRTGTTTVADFHTAVRLHRLLDTVIEANATGCRQSVAGLRDQR